MGDLGVPVRAQRGHRDRADPHQREIGDDERDRVRQLEDDPIQRLEARVEEAAGQPVDRLAQFPVAQAIGAADERDVLRALADRPAEPFRDRLALPQSGRAVAVRVGPRPRRASVQHRRPPPGNPRSPLRGLLPRSVEHRAGSPLRQPIR
jgi:hypothetical protein